jgi:lipase chaperone LimK
MFDYFLSAWGEQDLNAIVERIDREIQSQLPVPQSDAAKALLRKYLKYKEALVALDKTPSAQGQGVEAIRKRFEGMQALRGQFFTPREDEAMFGFDDAYDRDAIARLEIHQNTSLSEAQKRERMAVLDAAMPTAVKAEREAPRQIINLENQVAALRAQGATDAQVFNVRAKALNPEAAQRLAELDRDEQAWQARIADYQRERQRVLQSNANSSGSERESSLAQLQQSRFSPAEIPRLVAYEN